ncbi:reverse transcriptase domain-containing protein [Tanacetum coccineum]
MNFSYFMDNIHLIHSTDAVGNFVQETLSLNFGILMRPPGFNQPNVQNNQGNQSRYQGNNFNSNQNRGGNFNQNRQNNQGAVYQAPPYQPPTIQTPVYQAPTQQIQGVSKTDFENYVKANDAVLKNVQNQGQNLQNQMANVTSLLTSLCNNFKNSASTSNSGTLPSQTITNPREQINASTTRSGGLVGLRLSCSYTVVSIPSKNPIKNPGDVNGQSAKTKFRKYSTIPKKLEDPGKFLISCALQELDRTSALADSGASINLLPHSIYKQLGLEALTPTRMTLELANRSVTHPMGIAEDVVVRVDGFTFLADFVVVNFEPDPRVPIILGRPFLRTAKALIDLYEEKLTLRVGKEELVYYADKSEKNKEKKFVHAISIIDFSKDDPFSGSTTIPSDAPFPSSSPMKTSDSTFEEFTDEFTLPNSLPPGNDVSIHKKDIHEETFQIYSNPLFEFDDNFKSSNVNPLFEENDKDVEIKSSPSFTLTSPEESELEAYLEKDSIPPGIDLPSLHP